MPDLTLDELNMLGITLDKSYKSMSEERLLSA